MTAPTVHVEPSQHMTIRAPKDFWSGLMFLAFAAVAMLAARGYNLGTAGKMGPGYFPLLLGGVLAAARRHPGRSARSRSRASRWAGFILSRSRSSLSGCACSACSSSHLGLVVSLVIVILTSAVASRESRLFETVALAAVLAAFSVGVFVYALRLPFRIWPAF